MKHTRILCHLAAARATSCHGLRLALARNFRIPRINIRSPLGIALHHSGISAALRPPISDLRSLTSCLLVSWSLGLLVSGPMVCPFSILLSSLSFFGILFICPVVYQSRMDKYGVPPKDFSKNLFTIFNPVICLHFWPNNKSHQTLITREVSKV
jgi:hypothetical protein